MNKVSTTLLELLQTGRTISLDGAKKLGFNATKRVYDLRKAGYDVRTNRSTKAQRANGRTTKYTLYENGKRVTGKTTAPAHDQGRPHVHAQLIQQWVADVSQKVWVWNKLGKVWGRSPAVWHEDYIYAIGETPPVLVQATINLLGHEVPVPCAGVALVEQTPYYVPLIGIGGETVALYTWKGCEDDYALMAQGWVHLTKESAQVHSDALYEANRTAIHAVIPTN